MSETLEGGCLCGAVRFRASGAPKSVFWCHCQSCRRHSGAPVSVFVGFEHAAYTVTKGEVTKFKSSARTTRGFCSRCGSTLTCETTYLPTETHFHVGAFDHAEQLPPGKHVFRNEQLPWLHLAD
jgi:hypothetical protein